MSDGSNYLDPDRPEAVRLSVGEARALGEAALARIGYGADDACIITDQLIDNALCGYRFAGLPRILAIAREAKTRDTRVPVAVVHETPVSALVDGGNNVGYVAVYRGAEIAIAKAKQTGIAAFAMTADVGTPREAARRIGAAVAALGIERFDLMGEGSGLRLPCGWRSRPKQTSPVTRLYAERTANRREVEKMSGISDLGPVLQSRAGEYDIASKYRCARHSAIDREGNPKIRAREERLMKIVKVSAIPMSAPVPEEKRHRTDLGTKVKSDATLDPRRNRQRAHRHRRSTWDAADRRRHRRA